VRSSLWKKLKTYFEAQGEVMDAPALSGLLYGSLRYTFDHRDLVDDDG
jgi:hypothetical protein